MSGGFDPIDTTRLEKTAARHGATVQQVALAALLAASPVMLPIPGTGSLAHLEENIGAAGVRLTPEDIDSLAGLTVRTSGQTAGEDFAADSGTIVGK